MLNLLVGLAMGLNLRRAGQQPAAVADPRGGAAGDGAGHACRCVMEHELRWLVVVVAVATVAIKGFVIPGLLRRAMRTANIDRDCSR